jgi:uncharacterized protein
MRNAARVHASAAPRAIDSSDPRASFALMLLLTLAACGSRGERQPPVADSPAASPLASAPRQPTAADAPPPLLECPPSTRPTPITLEGNPGWACADREEILSGPFLTTYPDGATELSGSYKSGLLHGPWRRLYPSGKTAEAGAYLAGKKDGTWQLTTEGGGLLGDYQMKEGTGVEKRWYADGQLASERSYKDGLLDGPSAVYAAGGTPLYQAAFRTGVLDGARKLGLPGQLRVEDEWAKGVPRGPRKIFRRERSAVEQTFDEDGVLVGPYIAWRDRVTMREKGAYVAGKRHGLWRWFDRSRALEREGTYDHGARHGRWRQWSGGRLVMQGHYAKGKPNGVFLYWKSNGAGLAGRCTMRGGTGVMTTFHDNGEPAVKTQMVRGVRQGLYRELSPQGRVLVEGTYKDDQRDGPWIERDLAGRRARESTYAAGKLTGVMRRYAAGVLVVEQAYVGGLREGPYRELSPRASQAAVERITGEYAADRKSGEWIYRDDDGRPALVLNYQDGELHGAWQELDDGKIVVHGQYERGRRSGLWAWIAPNGDEVRTVTYEQP